MRENINQEYDLDKRGRARWAGALRAWREYLEKLRSDADRQAVQDIMKTIEQKAREEVRTLVNKAATPEDREGLKLHRPRFEGTAAAAELEKAIQGK